MQDCVYRTPVQNVADRRQCLVDTKGGFSQSIVDDVIDERRKIVNISLYSTARQSLSVRNFRPEWMR